MQTETRQRIANLISNIFNPFLAGTVSILILSFESASGVLDALKWALILIAIGILPVFLAAIYLVRKGKLDGIFTSIRRQRTRIYLVAGVCAGAGYAILHYSGAPERLVDTFATGLSAAVIFTVINLWWKISLHTALITALVTVLVILYGWIAMVAVVLVFLIGWARLELKQHSPAQVVAAALLSALIVVVGFHLFGLI